MLPIAHYGLVAWYQLVKPRLWQWRAALAPPVPDDTSFRALFPFGSASNTAFVHSFDTAVQPRLLFDSSTDRDLLRSLLVQIMDKEQIVQQADDILRGRFAVFSKEPIEFGATIDWHRDYKSNHVWPAEAYHRIDFMTSGGSDMKFPCEVSKFHRLSWLGMAHLLTGGEQYSARLTTEVTDWIQHNPVGIGINWTVSLEVAIRAVNWIQAYSFFRAAALPDSFTMVFLRSLYEHGLFLEHNLEYVRVPGNHFACNCLGLIALGTFFRDTRAGRRWLARGVRFIEQEILRQNTPDGVNFEKSIPYHRFITEIYTLALLFAEKGGKQLSQAYRQRLEAMYSYMAAYTRPDGSAPMIGDADNGRIMRYRAQEDFNNHSDNLAVGVALFKRPDFAEATFPSPDVLFALGPHAATAFPEHTSTSRLQTTCKSFLEGGYIVHRSAAHHWIIDCGDYGKKGRGGHGHNDCLSFELWALGSVLVGDSGTGVYTSDSILRDKLRSTRAHNTVMYKNREQVQFAGVWKIANDTTAPKLVEYTETGNSLDLIAEHYGYVEATRAVHRRTVHISVQGTRGTLIVEDEITGASPHDGVSYYHFPPSVTVEQTSDTTLRGVSETAVFELKSDLPIALARAPYSPLYGVVSECTELSVHCNNTVRVSWSPRLIPALELP